MNKTSHSFGVLTTLAVLTLMPLTAHAENFTDFTYIACGVIVVVLLIGAFICCRVIHKKTGNAMAWLLFPVWVYAGYLAYGLIGGLISKIVESFHHSAP